MKRLTSQWTSRRAFATVLVLWTVAVTALMLVAVQADAWRNAAAGRLAVAQVRARWAARAAVESAIARLAADTLQPDTASAFTTTAELDEVAEGVLAGATYRVMHTFGDGSSAELRWGPADAHSKLNINLLTAEQMLLIENMDEAIADAVLDWIDEDDDTRELGAERGYYALLDPPRQPRNAPMRSIDELELVAGVDPLYVRGEDWNLNGVLDPNEDDGDRSWPPDNADGRLDAGWSAFLTAESVDGGFDLFGEVKIDLATAAPEDLMELLNIDEQQAQRIIDYAAAPDATMEEFIRTDLSRLSTGDTVAGIPGLPQFPGGGGGGGGGGQNIASLSREQLAVLLDSAQIGAASAGPLPGKLNINTAPAEAFEYLGLDPVVSDMLVLDRDSRPEGYTSVVDLLDVPTMTRSRVADLAALMTVRSNVYVVTARGRDENTGLEVEIIATIDRSTLPITIRDYRAR